MIITYNTVFFMVLLIIIIIFFVYYFYIRNRKPKEYVDCVCVFDIDDTITCGLQNAKEAIDTCKERSCKLAINTARGGIYYNGIDFNALGIEPDTFYDDYYHGTWNKMSYASENELIDDIAKTKVDHLYTVQQKYSVPKDRVILFDDNLNNIALAKYNGFSTILANHANCGLPHNISR